MDEVLLPPGTPAEKLRLDQRVRSLVDLVDPPGVKPTDASLDDRHWPSWGERTTARREGQKIADEYLAGRRQFLFRSRAAQLLGDSIPASQPARSVVEIASAETSPVSGNPDEQFVSISNRNDYAVDISNWTIAGNGIRHAFRPGTVIPIGKHLYVTADVAAFRRRKAAPKGGQSLLSQGNFRGRLGAADSPLVVRDSRDQIVATYQPK